MTDNVLATSTTSILSQLRSLPLHNSAATDQYVILKPEEDGEAPQEKTKVKKPISKGLILLAFFLLAVAVSIGVGLYFGIAYSIENDRNLNIVACTSQTYRARRINGEVSVVDAWCQEKCTDENAPKNLCATGYLASICACAPIFMYADESCVDQRRVCKNSESFVAMPDSNVTHEWCESTCKDDNILCTCSKCHCQDTIPAGFKSILKVDFDNHEPNGMSYTPEFAEEDFGADGHMSGNFSALRMVMGPHGGTAMEVTYQEGCVGFKCTARFKSQAPLSFDPVTEVYLSLSMAFSPDFEWVKGGKLPATLCGGECPLSNGRPMGDDGWSSTLSFRPGAQPVNYVYHAGQMDDHVGDLLEVKEKFKLGTLQHIIIHVKMNTPGEADGILQTWVDGKLGLDKQDLVYRTTPDISIDTFIFSTFFGGLSPSYAPKSNMHALYDNFQLYVPA